MPETRFLFWNLNRKPIAHVAAAIASEQGSDVVVLAESGDRLTLLKEFNRGPAHGFHLTHTDCPAINILTRFASQQMRPVWESPRISMRRLDLPARPELLICAVHLPSKLFWSGESQALECVELARQIASIESHIDHRRTVVLGDFNMNPFEFGMVAANGLHGIMSRHVASLVSRKVQDRDYLFFYNPMWNHLGDLRGITAGTYYRAGSELVNYFWNVFDQVLMRPQLAEQFDPTSLQIVTTAGNQSLIRDDGRPDVGLFSDHLPIVFSLNF